MHCTDHGKMYHDKSIQLRYCLIRSVVHVFKVRENKRTDH